MRKILSIFLFIVLLFSCSKENQDSAKPITIAISKASGDPVYKNYINWLKASDSTIKIIDLFQQNTQEAKKLVDISDGLLLSGGPDPHPGRYGKTEDTSRCDIDLNRDTLEFAIYKYAKSKGLPVLGICRGMQVINVAEGGSLIVDIPSDVENSIDKLHQNGLPEDAIHQVKLMKNTELSRIVNLDSGKINCNHHQGIDKIASSLTASSTSEDGLIESFEKIDNDNWILAVQWHPERLEIQGLSKPIKEEFLKKIKQNREKLANSK